MISLVVQMHIGHTIKEMELKERERMIACNYKFFMTLKMEDHKEFKYMMQHRKDLKYS